MNEVQKHQNRVSRGLLSYAHLSGLVDEFDLNYNVQHMCIFTRKFHYGLCLKQYKNIDNKLH